MLSARSHAATPGVNGGKGTGGQRPKVFIVTLAPEGTQAPEHASRRDSVLDVHARVSERGNIMLAGRRKPCGSPLRAGAADGRRP